LNFFELDTQTLLLAGAALALAGGGILLWWRRRPRDPEEIERRRRSYLNQVGRIVEGEILEITERADAAHPARSRRWKRSPAPAVKSANGKRTLVLYSYSISGVSYQTAQDVTGMEARACLNRIVLGQTVSVKYDPANPGNSILIADDWSGLH
jgi:hypothetical protein